MNIKFLLRIVGYIIGLFFVALGVAFSVNSNLGISPATSVPYVLSLVSHFKLSISVIIVYILLITIQYLVNPKEFKLVNLAEILVAVVFGHFTDFTGALLGTFTFGFGYVGQLMMMLVSCTLIAIGVCIYINVKLVPMPVEGMQLAVANRLKKDFGTTKMILDSTLVVSAIILSMLFEGEIVGVREGTIISAIIIGRIVSLLQHKIKPFMEKICF